MASRSKKRAKRRVPADLAVQVRRHLKNGNYKLALKDAKACYRQSPCDEHRHLLEVAYAGRGQELSRYGMRNDCRRVLESLLELGVSDPSVEAALPELLLSVGLLDQWIQKSANAVQLDASLIAKAADYAVLRPHESPDCIPQLRSAAENVRSALEAVVDGEPAQGMQRLKDISRSSPFADWKLFVRGLAAYFREDRDEMLANWERLDPARFAARIATPLKVFAGLIPMHLQNAQVRSAVGRLEKAVGDIALLPQLAQMQECVDKHDWDMALQILRSVRTPLRKLDASLLDRLSAWLCARFVREGMTGHIARLANTVNPLPIDPNWNRAKALAHEIDDDDSDVALRYWRNYLDDLAKLTIFSAEEKKLARALILLHLGCRLTEKADALRDCPCGRSHEAETAEAEREAQGCFEKCLQLAPTHGRAYETVAEVYEEAGRHNEAAKVYRRALEHIPDHFEGLQFLAHHHLRKDAGLVAQQYATQMRRLKPLDTSAGDLLWSCHIASARQLAGQQRFDEGREQFSAADSLRPERGNDYDVLAKKAILEIKASCPERGRELVAQAVEELAEPGPLWLVMMIEGRRYQVHEQEVALYHKRWMESLRRRRRSETAGSLCKCLTAYLISLDHCVVEQEDVKQLLSYLRRATRVKWQVQDLREVCQFLKEVEEEELLKKFVDKGRRKFPDVAYFHWMAGTLEFERGPYFCNRRMAKDCYERVVQLAAESDDPQDERILQMARHRLTLLAEPPPEEEEDDDEYDEDDEPVSEDEIAELPREEMMRVLQQMCDEQGVDAEEVLRDLLAKKASSGTAAKRSRTNKK